MLIVCDTSPLRYLIEVDAIEFLPRLYGQVLTTPAVIHELCHDRFPALVKHWASRLPPWLSIQSPVETRFLKRLDLGEASAVSLAIEQRADVLLVDERKAARVARENGIKTAGTLAVLRDAGLAGLISFHVSVRRLTSETQFRHTATLIAQVIADYERELRDRRT